MTGITYTQVAQYVVLIFAYTFPGIFLCLQVTDTFLPQVGIFETTSFSFSTAVQYVSYTHLTLPTTSRV
ncbi:hypothetical protein CP962_14610 [Arcobacter ellisii]|uniref:Uncharacterized protein n=1 Tax=Arcobacter ellisii TaxID=913109 RepID=A0AA94F8P7_9BACT|nr:hypothetical protein CP962_14610 [Arcobacter ellisii]